MTSFFLLLSHFLLSDLVGELENATKVFTSMDAQGHFGTDGRYYLTNLQRSLPMDVSRHNEARDDRQYYRLRPVSGGVLVCSSLCSYSMIVAGIRGVLSDSSELRCIPTSTRCQ